MGKLSAAIGDYNSALRLDPKAGERASWPWICQAQNRRMADGNDDIAAARSIDAEVANKFIHFGVR